VLEYLIRRYHVHLYHIPSLLAAFLPYHDSPLFGRLLNVIQINLAPRMASGVDHEARNAHKLFGFLEAAQRAGAATVSRHTLVVRCETDPAFLHWMLSLIPSQPSSNATHPRPSAVSTPSTTTISFVCSVLLELLTSVGVGNNGNESERKSAIIRTITGKAVEVIAKQAKHNMREKEQRNEADGTSGKHHAAPARELLYSMLLIITQAASTHRLPSTTVDALLLLLCQCLPPPRQDSSLMQPVLMSLIALSQSQNVSALPPAALDAIIHSVGDSTTSSSAPGNIVTTLANLSRQYDVTHLLNLILPPLAVAHAGTQRKAVQELLLAILNATDPTSHLQLPLTHNHVTQIVRGLLLTHVSHHVSSGGDEWLSKIISSLRKLLSKLQEHHTAALERCIQELIQRDAKESVAEGKDEEPKKKKAKRSASHPLLTLIHLVFEGSSQELLDVQSLRRLNAAPTASGQADAILPSASLLSCLNSPLPHVRIHALEAVDDVVRNGNVSGASHASHIAALSNQLGSTLMAKFNDTEPKVIRALLKLNALTQLISTDKLMDALVKLMSRAASRIDSATINTHSGHKLLESACKLATKLLLSIADSQSEHGRLPASVSFRAALHSLLPYLLELSLLRPGVPVQIGLAVRSLFASIAQLARHAPRHHEAGAMEEEAEEAAHHAFHCVQLFQNIDKFDDEDDISQLSDPAAMSSYNDALLTTLATNLVHMLANHATHPDSQLLPVVEAELMSVLERTGMAITAWSRVTASSPITDQLSTPAPTSAFTVLLLLMRSVAMLAQGQTDGKKVVPVAVQSAAATNFIRLASHVQRRLQDVWQSFNDEQQRTSAQGSAFAILPTSHAYVADAALMQPNNFPAAVRAASGWMVQNLRDYMDSHTENAESEEDESSATAPCLPLQRALYAFFLSDPSSVSVFSVHLALFSRLHLDGGSLSSTLRFLLPILHQPARSTTALNVLVRSYHMLHAIMLKQRPVAAARDKTSKHEAVEQVQQLILAAFVAFASPSRALRHATILCIHPLIKVAGEVASAADKKDADASLLPLLAQLLDGVWNERDELMAAAATTGAENESLIESETDASLIYMQGFMRKMLDSGSEVSELKEAARTSLHRFFVTGSLRLSSVGRVWCGVRLLQLLRSLPAHVASSDILSGLSTLLSDRLATTSHTPIVLELLRAINSHVVEQETDAAFQCIMRAITCRQTEEARESDNMQDDEDEDVQMEEEENAPSADTNATHYSASARLRHATSIQHACVERLDVPLFDLLSGDQQAQLFAALLAAWPSDSSVGAVMAQLPFHADVFIKHLSVDAAHVDADAGKKKKRSKSAAPSSVHQDARGIVRRDTSVLELLQLKDQPISQIVSPLSLIQPLFRLLQQLTHQTDSSNSMQDGAENENDDEASSTQQLEYAKQLSMEVLTRLLSMNEAGSKQTKKSKKQTTPSDAVPIDDADVDSVLTCLRPAASSASSSLIIAASNTRVAALRLLSVLGSRHPDKLVGKLIPMFLTLLADMDDDENAQDTKSDDHSASYAHELLHSLISSVLPSIVRAQLDFDSWQLLSVFVESLLGRKSTQKTATANSQNRRANDDGELVNRINTRTKRQLFYKLLTSLRPVHDSSAIPPLDAMITLLVIRATSATSSPSLSAALLSFTHELSEQWSDAPLVQIQSFTSLVRLLERDMSEMYGESKNARQGEKLRLTSSKKGKAASSASSSSSSTSVSPVSRLFTNTAHRHAWQSKIVLFVSHHLSRLSFAQQIYRQGERDAAERNETAQADVKDQNDDDGSGSHTQMAFLQLFEVLFSHLRHVSVLSKPVATSKKAAAHSLFSSLSDSERTILSAHFDQLSTHTNDALHHLNGLLSMKNFLRILHALFTIAHASGEERADSGDAGAGERDLALVQQALNMLHSKLVAYKDREKIEARQMRNKNTTLEEEEEDESDSKMKDVSDADTSMHLYMGDRIHYYRIKKQEQRLLVSLLPSLQHLLTLDAESSSSPSTQLSAVHQSALLNLEMLASSFAHLKQFQQQFVAVVPTVMAMCMLPQEEQDGAENETESDAAAVLRSPSWPHVATSSLLFLSTLLNALHTKAPVLMIEYVPIMVPNAINILKLLQEQQRQGQQADELGEDERSKKNGTALDKSLSLPLLHLACLSLLQASIVTLSDFISPYLADLLGVLLYPTYHASNASAGSASSAAAAHHAADQSVSVDQSSIGSVVSQSLNSLLTLVPSRLLLPAIFTHYKVAFIHGYASLRRLFTLLAQLIQRFQPDQVKQHFKIIFKFFIAAAQQIRNGHNNTRQQDEDDDEPTVNDGCTMSDAEDALVDSFIELTMKLNETSFKGLFLKMLSWVGPPPNALTKPNAGTPVGVAAAGAASSTSAPASSSLSLPFLSRSLLFFKLVSKLTSKLKGIFVTYIGYILDHCVAFITYQPTTHNKKSKTTNKKQASEDADEEEENDESESEDEEMSDDEHDDGGETDDASPISPLVLELVELVLTSLRNTFLHDHHHFLDKYHFQQLTQPIIGQLSIAQQMRRGSKEEEEEKEANDTVASQHLQSYDAFITHTLTPTVVQLAQRMGNYLHWKPLVGAIMSHGRSPHVSVRRASVYVLEQSLVAVGENFLVLLPELLPWIAEMMEDEDEGVERKVHKLVKIIEKMSGESLDETLHG